MRGVLVAVFALFGLACCSDCAIVPSGIDIYEKYIIADVVVTSPQQGMLIEELSDSLCGSISLFVDTAFWFCAVQTCVMMMCVVCA